MKMWLIPIVIPLIGHVLKPLVERAGELIADKIFKKKEEKVHGTIETKYPRVEGVGNPWLAPTMYNKAYKSNPLNVEVSFEENRLQGLVKAGIPGLEGVPTYSVQMGILELGFIYSSEVILEEQEDFLGDTELKLKLLFSSPIKSVWFDNLSYKASVLEIPLEFMSPCASVTTQIIPPPQVVPRQAPDVTLPPGKKQKAEIPILGRPFE